LSQFDLVEKTFCADIGLKISWTDPRAAGKLCSESLPGVWRPEVVVLDTSEEPVKKDDAVEIMDADQGCLQRYIRLLVKIRCAYSLRMFPHDSQDISIVVRVPRHRLQGVADISFHSVSREPTLLCDDEFELISMEGSARHAAVHSLDWEGDEPEAEDGGALTRNLSNLKPEFVVQIRLRRRPQYWLWCVVVPTLCSVLVGFDALLMEPSDHNDRMSLVVTLMLTVVAVRFTVNDKLPRLPFLTFLDCWLLLLFFTLVLLAVECSFVYAVRSVDGGRFSRRVDTACAISVGSFVLAVSACAWRGGGSSQLWGTLAVTGIAVAWEADRRLF
jgi:hypothetical protein